jgi:serine/threonine-protein kinase
MQQVALALQKAHEQGIVHRDIKPENILVTRKVEVKVTDFGLSRFFAGEMPATNLTQSGVTLGTPLYMSPEQVQGHTLDHRSDIYSFGVTCYHLLAGEPPFRGTTAFDVALKHVQEQPRLLSDLRPDLPADVCGMIHKMMAKNPDDRYQSARDILRDLVKVRDGLSLSTTRAAALPVGAPAASSASASAFSLSQSGATPAPGGGRWGRWVLVALACALAACGGAVAHVVLKPAEPHAAAPTQGLPDVRAPEKLTTTRERELLAVLRSDVAKPDEITRASVELGLLYLQERRLPDATDRFGKLRQRGEEWRDPIASRTATTAGRLGQAVVLAHEDKAEQSNKLFLEVVNDPAPKLGPGVPKSDRFAVSVSWTLLRYPDLSAAVSDALNCNAANLGKPKLETALEQLRSPQRVGKKE